MLTFELATDPLVLVALMAVAFLAGFIDAIAGGGGLLTLPALLTAGLPPHLVLGTNKLCATFGSATASFTFYRRKLFHPQQWRSALLAAGRGFGTYDPGTLAQSGPTFGGICLRAVSAFRAGANHTSNGR
jgi:uncharacterized protein